MSKRKERLQVRLSARTERVKARQAGKNSRQEMRSQAKAIAAENGVDTSFGGSFQKIVSGLTSSVGGIMGGVSTPPITNSGQTQTISDAEFSQQPNNGGKGLIVAAVLGLIAFFIFKRK